GGEDVDFYGDIDEGVAGAVGRAAVFNPHALYHHVVFVAYGLVVQRPLFDVGQEVVQNAAPRRVGGFGSVPLTLEILASCWRPTDKDRIVAVGGRHSALVRVRTVVQSEDHLMEVVLGLGASRGVAHFLHGGQQQADEDGNDRNYHQQLDQREAAPT